MESSAALSEALRSVRFTSTVYCRAECRAPWGIGVPASRRAHFHVMVRGHGFLTVEGEAAPRALAGGDLVLLPRGHAHALVDRPETEPRAITSLLADKDERARRGLEVGATGALTTFVCGGFEVEDFDSNPLLNALPSAIVVRGDDGDLRAWLPMMLHLLESEAASGRPGGDVVLTRLADILLVHIVRAYVESLPEGATGWLGALRDPHLGAALAEIHRRPEHPWTVASLATAAGLSRSAFAARFSDLLGESPGQYLLRWRMHEAAALLRDGDHGLAEVASRFGYRSEASFSRAFKRLQGLAPGAYRRRARGADVARSPRVPA